MIYTFADFELDEERCELRRGGVAVPLEPKPFAVLQELVRHRDRVVSKQELTDAVWSRAPRADESLSRAIGLVRRALGDTSAEPRFVQTFWRRGFRFVAPVQQRSVAGPEVAPGAGPEARPFVGRADLLARLERALADASAGRGGIVLLAGEPGIGKTRTAEKLAEIAAARSARVLTGWGSSQPGAPPYWLWMRILRGLVETLDDTVLRGQLRTASCELARLVPELGPRLADPSPADGAPAESSPFRLFAAVAAFLRGATRQRPLVLVLDDLQWADRSSLRLLESLAGEISHRPMLVVLAARDVELDTSAPVQETLAALERQCRFLRLDLGGLEPAEVTELVAQLRASSPSEAEARAIASRSGGNPFFVRELALAEGGAAASAGESAPLPRFLRAALHARLRRLQEPGAEALEAAALSGERFDAAVVAEAIAREPDAVARDLVTARREALVVHGPSRDQWRFAHSLVHDAVRAGVPEPRARALHLALAHAIRARHADDLDDHAADVARHLEAALPLADRAQAVAWAARAGDVALQRLAYDEGVAHYERALRLAEEGEAPERGQLARLTLGLARSRWLAGQELRSFETYQRAGELASEVGDTVTLADAAIGAVSAGRMAGVDVRTAYVALLEKALAALPEHERRRRALVTARLAWTSSGEERRRLTARALELAEALRDPEALVNALFAAHMVYDPLTEVAERLAVASRMFELAGRGLAAGWIVEAGRLRVRDLLTCGRVREAEEESGRLLEHAERERHPTYLLLAHLQQASRLLWEGRFEPAEQRIQTALATLGPVASSAASQMAFAQMLVLRALQGRLAEMAHVFDRFTGRSHGSLAWRCGQTWALYRLGRRAEAQRGLDELAPRSAETEDDYFQVGRRVLLAEVAAGLGARAHCDALYRELAPGDGLQATLADVVLLGCISRPLGLLAAALGRADDAERHFERALEAEARMGARPWLAETRLEYAGLLAGRRAAHDRERALALLDEVDGATRELGMPALAARADACRERLRKDS